MFVISIWTYGETVQLYILGAEYLIRDVAAFVKNEDNYDDARHIYSKCEDITDP
jgi:hypothetical protein